MAEKKAVKKQTSQKQTKKSENIEERTSGFGLWSFFLISIAVIVLGCVAAYSLRDIPTKKRPMPVQAEAKTAPQILPGSSIHKYTATATRKRAESTIRIIILNDIFTFFSNTPISISNY